MAIDPRISGKMPLKGVLQNHPYIVIFENDHRNNDRYLKHHPEVIVKEVMKISINLPENINQFFKCRPEMNTLGLKKRELISHPSPGFEMILATDKEYRKPRRQQSNPWNHKALKRLNDETDFIFHEILKEIYDMEKDDELESGAHHVPVPVYTGHDHSGDNIDMPAPSNLQVVYYTSDLDQSPEGGSPDWEITLSFIMAGNPDDFEIRLVKVD